MSDKGTFSERIEEILGDGRDDATTITLRRHADGPTVIVTVAIGTDKHGVIRQHALVPMEKFTGGNMMCAAEDAYGTLTTAIAIFAAGTPTFEEESDVG